MKNVTVQLPELVLKELFVDPATLQEKLGLPVSTLLALRRDGTLIQGIHFSEINSRLLLYNLPLMIDWVVNRQDPSAHQRGIEQFLKTLPSNQPKLKNRKLWQALCKT